MVDHVLDQSKNNAFDSANQDPSLQNVQQVSQALHVDVTRGLSSEEASKRLAQFGPNALAAAPKTPAWKRFLDQFKDPLVYLLIAATIISAIAWFVERAQHKGNSGGEILPFDSIVIIIILIANAVLGFIQESRAEEAVEALARMSAPQTSVLRD